MEFSEYQESAKASDRAPEGSELLVPLLGLAGEAGEVLSEYKKYLRDGDAYTVVRDRIGEELGDLLWYVSMVATRFNLSLDDIASRNLTKVRTRWIEGQQAHLPAAFDNSFPEPERFPRRFTVTISAAAEGAAIRLGIDGHPVGDPLTDNNYVIDDYRFHDVFHLAYTAVLGWSPVTRRLLGRKRRSDPTVDEVEDGGRATAIEEAISAIVFDYARQHKFLEGIKKLDLSLLKLIKRITAHLEVGACSHGQWEEAILAGYHAWRDIRNKGGGILSMDLDARSITAV